MLAVALLMAAQAPETEDWWYLTACCELGQQQAFYADRASIRRDGDMALVEEAREGERSDEQDIIGARLLVRYDCRSRTSQVMRYTFLLANGARWTAPRHQEQAEVVEAGSVKESTIRFACGEGDGLEQLGTLGIREQALLLFRDRAEHLRANPGAAH